MDKTFRTFANRLDQALVGFSADDNAALLADICLNSATAHVRQRKPGGPISVPAHAAASVQDHLVRRGWTVSA